MIYLLYISIYLWFHSTYFFAELETGPKVARWWMSSLVKRAQGFGGWMSRSHQLAAILLQPLAPEQVAVYGECPVPAIPWCFGGKSERQTPIDFHQLCVGSQQLCVNIPVLLTMLREPVWWLPAEAGKGRGAFGSSSRWFRSCHPSRFARTWSTRFGRTTSKDL